MKALFTIIILSLIPFQLISEIGFKKHVVGEKQQQTMCVIAVDIDGDGDKDILSSSYNNDGLIWWENDGRQQFKKHIVWPNYGNVRTAYPADLDRDGDIDILATSYDFTPDPNTPEDALGRLSWFENDGKQNFKFHLITKDFEGAHTISSVDIDGDGDIDILAAAYTLNRTGRLSWFENNGKQQFKEHVLSEKGATCVYGYDIDKDGDSDILGTYYMNSEISWWENDGKKGFSEKPVSKQMRLPHWARAVDMDGDGDLDIVGAGCGRTVSWWENDGKQTFSEHRVSSNFACASSIYAADMDGDGDMDLLSTSENHHDIRWWENDGKQQFREHTVSGLFPGASDVYVADMDGDGDMDILAAGNREHQVSWWENLGKKHDHISAPLDEDQFFVMLRAKGIQAGIEYYDKLRDKIRFREQYMIRFAFELMSKRRMTDGIEILKLNARAFPESVNGQFSLAEAYTFINNMETAKTHYHKTAKMDRTQAPFHQYLKLAILMKDKATYQHLINDLKKNNVSKYKLRENVLNFLGYQMLQRNLVSEAILLFKTNTELFPASFNVFDSLGEGYMRAGKKELAIQNYEKSLKLNPNNKNAVKMLGDLKQGTN